MLLHVAITIHSLKEIEDFYKEILRFTVQRKFSLNRETSQKIFSTEEVVEVYLMEHQSVQFEIFISRQKEKKLFSHVCLAYRQALIIYEKAISLGYRTLVKSNKENNTYFVWDKSGNMFEIKEIHSK
ncbi:VOC family protein [Draconibacterium orientale]|uniref:VOC family protein n=1 Tax=Draconibacterium orientale TaxID=1168034 RepID=UPI002ABE37EE|nr:VOC family protein [Draconibacterium orientale]